MKSKLFLVFGEDQYDCDSIANLIRAISKVSPGINIRTVRKPPVLRRDASLLKRRSLCQDIANFERAFKGQANFVVVVAHRECDAMEPAHEQEANALEKELKAQGVSYPIGATPAWEIEAWWLLFPKALKQARACWSEVDVSGANVGHIKDAKEYLRRRLRPKSAGARGKCPDYTEGDSVIISRCIQQDPSAVYSTSAISNSFNRFRDLVVLACG